MTDTIDRAASLFERGYSCSQSLFAGFAPPMGLPEEQALRIAGGFGGGMGRLGEVCGAVTGAFMVIGLREGSTAPGDDEAKERTYALVRKFAARFGALHGSLLCRDLLDCAVDTPEGLRRARDDQLFAKTCPAVVRDAAAILTDLFPQGEVTGTSPL